jgi:hypothetical protein
MGTYKINPCFPGDEEELRRDGWEALENGIENFLHSHGHAGYDKSLTPKIGRFILTLASTEPDIPLAGKRLRDLSAKQRVLFQSSEYEGTKDGEFLGNWIDAPRAFFLFSRRTVKVVTRGLLEPSPYHKTLVRLCHERPDPVISYEKLAMAVPRFVKDMQSKMKYLSVDKNYKFENAERPGKGLWIRTTMVNVLLSILDHQDVHVHRGKSFVAIYNRWFAAYFEGE